MCKYFCPAENAQVYGKENFPYKVNWHFMVFKVSAVSHVTSSLPPSPNVYFIKSTTKGGGYLFCKTVALPSSWKGSCWKVELENVSLWKRKEMNDGLFSNDIKIPTFSLGYWIRLHCISGGGDSNHSNWQSKRGQWRLRWIHQVFLATHVTLVSAPLGHSVRVLNWHSFEARKLFKTKLYIINLTMTGNVPKLFFFPPTINVSILQEHWSHSWGGGGYREEYHIRLCSSGPG